LIPLSFGIMTPSKHAPGQRSRALAPSDRGHRYLAGIV
jgi:hypothetical protein